MNEMKFDWKTWADILAEALEEYQCPGLDKCAVLKLEDGSCMMQWSGCGDKAHKALAEFRADCEQITKENANDQA